MQDLAALLPNLSQIRRPSKSSIVNSSIAHIHASRRHRILAARELRAVKSEADALRRELNEWRDRAGIPRIEEPIRDEGFSMVLSGELEVIAAIPGDEDEDAELHGYGAYGDEGDDDYPGSATNAPQSIPAHHMDEMDDPRMAMIKNANVNPFAHSLPPAQHPHHLAHILPRPAAQGGPMIASPTGVAFENPAMNGMYEPQQFAGAHFLQQQQQQQQHQQHHEEKIASWNAAHMYGGSNHHHHQQMIQAQRSLFTPPATSHGLPGNASAPAGGAASSGAPNPFVDPASQAFFVNLQRQQMIQQQQQQMGSHGGHVYGSPERDDASSVGSAPRGGSRGERERSGSLSNGSGYGGSPPHHGSYELGPGEYSAARASVGGGGPGRGGAGWGRGDVGVEMGMGKAIAAGGGGNGGGFSMMM